MYILINDDTKKMCPNKKIKINIYLAYQLEDKKQQCYSGVPRGPVLSQ